MYQLVASYAHPDSSDAFLNHYRNTHVPLAAKFPNVRSFTWSVCESQDGTKPPHFVVAVVMWDSKEDSLEALASAIGQDVVADLGNFAGAGVDVEFGEVTSVV